MIDPDEDNFTIKDINTPEQTVDDSSNTVWRWNVKAVKGGDNKVYLIATVKIFDKNGASNKDVKLIIKKIHVKAPFLVKAKQFTGDYWQYILSAFIIPFIGWAINKIRKSKKRKNVPVGFQIPPKKTDTKDKK